jgi:DNA-binding NtrC family response regulator
MPQPAPPPPRALLIDCDAGFLADLQSLPGMQLMRFEQASGPAHALRLLRRVSYDVVLTSPRSPIAEDLSLVEEMQLVRPWVKAIVLAPSATPQDVIASLRTHVFACFTAPFAMGELAEMIRRAVLNPELDDLPHAAVSNPPDDPIAHIETRAALGLRPGGFGLLIARRIVDEMLHSEKANEVVLIKHLR